MTATVEERKATNKALIDEVLKAYPEKMAKRRAKHLGSFEEGKPESLAQAIASLQDAAVYRRVSQGSAAAWESIQVPLKSGELLTRWLTGTNADIAALKTFSLQQLGRVV